MWLVRNKIANILCLPQLESEGYRVTYDSVIDWVIHLPDGTPMTHSTKLVLKRGRGLCAGFLYLDMADPDNKDAVVMLQMVHANTKGLTSREVNKAVLASKSTSACGNSYRGGLH